MEGASRTSPRWANVLPTWTAMTSAFNAEYSTTLVAHHGRHLRHQRPNHPRTARSQIVDLVVSLATAAVVAIYARTNVQRSRNRRRVARLAAVVARAAVAKAAVAKAGVAAVPLPLL